MNVLGKFFFEWLTHREMDQQQPLEDKLSALKSFSSSGQGKEFGC